MNFFDHFDRVAVVNLPERTDRKKETLEEFRRAGWQVPDGSDVFFPAVRPETSDGFPSKGAKGCFLSHLEILKQARAERLGAILLLEDDIAFARNVEAAGRNIMERLEGKNWDFLYFGHEHPDSAKHRPGLETTTDPLRLTHFYAVNSSCMDRFIDFLETVLQRPAGHPDGGPMHYDGAISTFREQNPDIITYISWPTLGFQRSSRTDLLEPSVWDRWKVLAPITAMARKLKNALYRIST
ncbi:glycosyltransferase family 25 protein [Chlorobium sp. N1]|uniref:glycosyltransferase family 25 protein n=1 Tax=Chlorobium sp. N1 TaxID=2491138 RepID=UPI00103A79D0|nr:glycosyltransferase family 25 protein [Chlorobium sp. N1]TCD48557.1 LPS biosynthesis glycosyltransferase [Chlorobium sp. N1]